MNTKVVVDKSAFVFRYYVASLKGIGHGQWRTNGMFSFSFKKILRKSGQKQKFCCLGIFC